MRHTDFSRLHGSSYEKFRNLYDIDASMPEDQLKNFISYVQGTINDPRKAETKIPYTEEAEYMLVRKDEYIQEFLSKKKVVLPKPMGIGTKKKIREINSQQKKPDLLPLEILDAYGNLWQLNQPEVGK